MMTKLRTLAAVGAALAFTSFGGAAAARGFDHVVLFGYYGW
jgi:hypothetical protein